MQGRATGRGPGAGGGDACRSAESVWTRSGLRQRARHCHEAAPLHCNKGRMHTRMGVCLGPPPRTPEFRLALSNHTNPSRTCPAATRATPLASARPCTPTCTTAACCRSRSRGCHSRRATTPSSPPPTWPTLPPSAAAGCSCSLAPAWMTPCRRAVTTTMTPTPSLPPPPAWCPDPPPRLALRRLRQPQRPARVRPSARCWISTAAAVRRRRRRRWRRRRRRRRRRRPSSCLAALPRAALCLATRRPRPLAPPL